MKREVEPSMLRIDLLFGGILATSVLFCVMVWASTRTPVPEVGPKTPPTIRVAPNVRGPMTGVYSTDDDHDHPEFAAVFDGDVLINGSLIVMGPDGRRTVVNGCR